MISTGKIEKRGGKIEGLDFDADTPSGADIIAAPVRKLGAGGVNLLFEARRFLPLPACGERVASTEGTSRVKGAPPKSATSTPPHPPGFALRRSAGRPLPRARGEVKESA